MFLEEIVARKREDLIRLKETLPLTEVEVLARQAAPPRSFTLSLQQKRPLALIAEVKRASPSKGDLKPDLDAAALAQIYVEAGAAAVSVLTEEHFFQGSLDDLRRVREAVAVPVLCKDFLIDPYQVYLARAHGADAVLLIAALLEDAQQKELLGLAHELGMAALVEVHTATELERVRRTRAQVIGINNRNLVTFATDFRTCLNLKKEIPPDRIAVAESGIRTPADIARLVEAGFAAALIGETLVTAPSPGAKIRELLGG
ncbi:MAG TPA: indole-3-glycerol phosphate synthase TrpC [Firmicutes bacterium]|nr:indole-3-glycerol phosphate synthase TrpC [Bacillota bacterium]